MTTRQRTAQHEAFWDGKGPSLILIPASRGPQYDTENYLERFHDPELMWAAEMRHARTTLDWPTDGIPTVRPNLGVIFIPGAVGQCYVVRQDQMPWTGAPLSRAEIRCLPTRDIESSELMSLARRFYERHRAADGCGVFAYQPDTQGIFSLAHLFYGDRMFTDLVEDPGWVHELLEITLSIHTRVVRALKTWIGERHESMAHGHSFPAGVWFPHAGVRISEDTATMVSPRMLPEFVLPYTRRAVAPWGGCFVHYCGKHRSMFEELCRMPEVCAIDLGNPEMYDTHWLLEHCGETGTVLYSSVKPEADEAWEPYLRRIAAMMKETGARLILRPSVFPDTREECARMLGLWHELTV